MRTRLPLVVALVSLHAAAFAQTTPAAEPPTLDVLRSSALRVFEDTADTLHADGHLVSDLPFRIELPALMHAMPFGGFGPRTIMFGTDIDGPRFTIAHFEEGISREPSARRAEFAVAMSHGEAERASWVARVCTMRPAAYEPSFMRALPPGERRWIEVDVHVRQTTPSGDVMACSMNVAPFSRARYGTTDALAHWTLERCASLTSGVAPSSPP